MGTMTNRKLLEQCIERSGLKKGKIAEAMGKTINTFSRKLAGKQDFTESEMRTLARILHLSAEERIAIFFADEVGRMATE